jgi:hypothetical protein
MQEINVEAECRNCNHAIDMHKPKCTVKYHDITREQLCQCDKPQYFGVIISDQYIGWSEFHCNNCSKLIGFLDTLDENVYDSIHEQTILCVDCTARKKSE